MKLKTVIILAAILAMGLSFWTGTFLGRAHSAALNASFDASLLMPALDQLYRGNTNDAIKRLDEMLDTETFRAGKTLNRPLLPRVRNQLHRAISRTQKFRTEYPRINTEVDAMAHAYEMPAENRELIEERIRYQKERNRIIERTLKHEMDAN